MIKIATQRLWSLENEETFQPRTFIVMRQEFIGGTWVAAGDMEAEQEVRQLHPRSG